LNRNEKLALESGLRSEQSRIEKLHDGPQIADVILDRRSGQRDAVAGLERARRASLFAFGILDVLGLIEHDAAPAPLGKHVDVALQ